MSSPETGVNIFQDGTSSNNGCPLFVFYQEVWGLLLPYNLIRREASRTAEVFARAPSDIRFKPACQYIAVQLIVMAAANPVLRRH